MAIEGSGNVNRIVADKINVNQVVMIPTISYPRKENHNRNKKWGNTRYETLRAGSNDKILNVAEQTEASKKVLHLVAQCGYSLTQVNGQRIFGPPLDWTGPAPGSKCEIFVGKIPRMLYEHDIYPVFSCIGKIYEIRLMMDFSGMNRGYCFIMYTKQEDAFRAVKELDHYEICPGRRIGVVASINYCRLCVNQIPLDVKAESVVKRIYEMTGDVEKVAVYKNTNGSLHYALISYKTHRGAAMARRRLVPESSTLFPGGRINVEWAHPNFHPSNVFEELGTCDDAGNITMTKTYVPSTKSKKTAIRRSSRKNGQGIPHTTNESTVADLKKLQKTIEPDKQITRCKSLLANFDQSTTPSITLAYNQPNHRDQHSINMSDKQNQYNQMLATQDPMRQNNEVENVDRKKEDENIVPKLYDVKSYQNDENHSNPLYNSPTLDCFENNSYGSNINPLAASFEQQDGQFPATNTFHIDQSFISNNPTLNNQLNLDDPVQREISLKLQAKALFQPNNEPWQNYSPQLNSSFQPNDSLQPNCTLTDGNLCQNVPFHYDTYKSQLLTNTYPAQPFQELNNQDFNQCRLVVTNGLQNVWDMITKMRLHNPYRAFLEFNRLNQRANKLLASFNNHVSSGMAPQCYYQEPCPFVSGHPSTNDNVFNKPNVPIVKCTKERPRIPRPILNRTRVDGSYN